MRYFVTGCAGFIGSTLVDRLIQHGHEVIGFDNFSTGLSRFIENALHSPKFKLYQGDLLDRKALTDAMQGCESVFHLAANADVRWGTSHPHKDLEQNTLATFHVLEAMRHHQIKRVAFASTGSIYGEATIIPTPEHAFFPIQTSLYGASKLAAEGFIQAYCEGFGFQAYIFRFVSILGPRYTHGHVIDFYRQLINNPQQLTILGDGKQRKSYLHVEDCIDAILLAMQTAHAKVNIFNLGTDEYCQVNDSIQWLCEHLQLAPELIYSGGDRGWVGDNPFIFLDCHQIRACGWKPRFSIRESIIQTVEFLQNNPWVLEDRA